MKRSTPVVFGNARFTVYSPGCVRLEYSQGGQFSDGPSLLVGRKMAKAMPADVAIKAKKLIIKTPRFELIYQDDGQVFSPANLGIRHTNYVGQPMTWTPGKRDGGNLGTVTRSLDQWKWCGGPTHYPVEGILSTDGGHFVQDDHRVYWNPRYDWPECRGHVVAYDGYFFAYGDDYKAALKDFVTVFGRIPMVPRWTFGFWYSRWYAYSDQEVLNLVRRYRKEGVPMDVMIIDTDWRKGWGGYDWNPKFFPKPARTLKQLHNLGVRVSLNDHPGYDNYDALPADDSHIPAVARRLGPLPHQGQWACDWSNQKAVRAWKDIVLGPLFDQGMDFWWVDGWVKPPFAGTDSQLWANRVYFELAEERTKKRGMILARWGGVGSHRYPVQFSGDTPSEWSMLQHQVEFTSRSGNLGAVYWSHDIGGFFGREIDEELFIRWAQFGAMSPVFRTHSDHGIREPWAFSPRARALFRKQARIRYALAPYFYTLAREAHDTGLPIARPLYLEYNDNDGGALWRKHQYLLGRDLLVIPADAPVDARSGLLRKRAFFPRGQWVEVETGEEVNGILDGAIDIPIERIPTYVRRGAILPTQPVGDQLGVETPSEIHFEYYPDPAAASEYELYEDEGESHDHERGRFARIAVRAVFRGKQIEMTVGRPRGQYKGMPRRRTLVLRVALPAGVRAARAQVQGLRGDWRNIPAVHSAYALAGTLKTARVFVEVRLPWALNKIAVRFTLDNVWR